MGLVEVTQPSEFMAKLAGAQPGDVVELKNDIYPIEQPLVVPEGVTLQGVTRMRGLEGGGHWLTATGIYPDQESRLVAAASLAGDMLTLSDGALLRNLTIVDFKPRKGNLVVVKSTAEGERISAKIVQCALINPNPSDADDFGPIGRGLLVCTRSPNGIAHTGATLTVELRQSVIESPGNGSGVFAINFARDGRVFLQLSQSTIGGGLDANGGVSRPTPVSGAQTHILSNHNHYRSDGPAGKPAGTGWYLHGGSNPPPPTIVVPGGTHNNTLIMKSYRDSVSGFQVGIYAAGGWRPHANSGAVSHNCLDIDFRGTNIAALALDYVLLGAEAGGDFLPGHNNRLRATRDPLNVSTFAPNASLEASIYLDSANGEGDNLTDQGTGNRLELYGIKGSADHDVGSLEQFYCGPSLEMDGP